MDNNYLSYVEERLVAVANFDPGLLSLPAGHGSDPSAGLSARRDLDAASAKDLIFIANALRDLRRLVQHVRGEARLGTDELLQIQWRVQGSSQGLWIAHLEDDKTGGSDIISLNDGTDPRDLYLFIDGREAPPRLYEEIALAHQDIPALLQWIRASDHERHGIGGAEAS